MIYCFQFSLKRCYAEKKVNYCETLLMDEKPCQFYLLFFPSRKLEPKILKPI